MWPSPSTIQVVVVSSLSPIGPRAWSFWVEMPQLGTQAQLAAVGESGRGIDHDRRRVHTRNEGTDDAHVLSEDRLGVPGGVGPDVVDGLVQVLDDAHGQVQGAVLGVPVLLGGLGQKGLVPAVGGRRGQDPAGGRVRMQDDVLAPQGGGCRREVGAAASVWTRSVSARCTRRRAGSWH